jgi:hypothetical protein
MAGKDFLEEQRRRQRELVAARTARQNPDAAPAPVKVEEAPKTFGERMQNFWFYNKYFVLAAVFLAVLLVIAVRQCADRESFDTEIVLFTYHSYAPDQITAIEEELEKYGVDINGDGKVNIQILDCAYDKKTTVFDQKNAKGSKLVANITSNEKAVLFITDAETHEHLEKTYATNEIDFFVDLGLPADGGCSVMLGDDFYSSVEAKDTLGLKLPKGLRISRRIAGKNTLIGSAEKQVAAAEKMLSNIKYNQKNEAAK